jgi:DUF1680 family protein
MDAMVAALLQYQKDDGYLFVATTLDSKHWEENNTVWMARYILLGLCKYYETFGYQPALDAAVKLGDNFMQYYGPGKKQIGSYDAVMLESMVLLYRLSGKKQFLDCCHWIMDSFVGPKFVDEMLHRPAGWTSCPIAMPT